MTKEFNDYCIIRKVIEARRSGLFNTSYEIRYVLPSGAWTEEGEYVGEQSTLEDAKRFADLYLEAKRTEEVIVK